MVSLYGGNLQRSNYKIICISMEFYDYFLTFLSNVTHILKEFSFSTLKLLHFY